MEKIAKVIFIIVTRNSKLFMQPCLDSILNQTYRDFAIGVIDNNSADGTAEFIRNNYPMVSVIENNKNLGFAKANNQAVKLFKSDYVVFCNPDIILEKDWLEIMMLKVEKPELSGYSVFGGKLLKLKFNNLETGDFEKTEIIDSCGLQVFRNGRFSELGAGDKADKFITDREVFGHGGALVLFKRSVLDDIILIDKYHPQGDYFDGSFFLYKEDVDLALRLKLFGHKSLLITDAIAYHLRTFSASETDNFKKLVGNRKRQGELAKYYSYRNHLLLLFSNFFTKDLFRYFIYIFIFEFKNLKAWLDILKMIPEIKSKRKFIFSKARITSVEFRRWIS